MPIRTVSPAGGNYNSSASWIEGFVPTSADDIVWNLLSGNLTVNVASACASIDFTNAIGNITFTASITVSGNCNLGTGGYTQLGAGGLIFNANATITNNGVTWSRILRLQGVNITYTLADVMRVTGALTLGQASSTITINGFTIYASSDMNYPFNACTIQGTTNLNFDGTSNIAGSNASYLANNFTINTTGAITFGAFFFYKTGAFIITAVGSISFPTSIFLIADTCTIDTAGYVINNLKIGDAFSAASVIITEQNILKCINLQLAAGGISFAGGFGLAVLGGNLTLSDSTTELPNDIVVRDFITNGGGTATINGVGKTLTVTGNVIHPSGFQTGTALLRLVGNGYWTDSSNNTYGFQQNIEIAKGAIYRVIGELVYGTGTFTLNGKLIPMNNRNGATANRGLLRLKTSCTLIGFDKPNFKEVVIVSSATIIMDEFFQGSPVLKTRISTSAVLNYTISFIDTRRKVSKFIRISNATITTRNQLIVMGGDDKNKGGNVGVSFQSNVMPNGFALGDGFGDITYGVGESKNDPALISRI